jgi:hypothetical protein
MKKISKLLIGTNNKENIRKSETYYQNTSKRTQHRNLNLRVQEKMGRHSKKTQS